MDQDPANLDFSSSQHACLHVAVPAEDGHKDINADGEQTPNAIDNVPTAAGHKTAHTPRLHHDVGYPPQKTYSTPAPSLFGTTPTGNYDPTPFLSANVYDTPTGNYDPTPFLSANVYDTPTGNYDPTPFLSANVYDTPTGYYDPTACLSGNVYEAPTGFYDPNPGWLNPSNAAGTRGYDYTDPIRNMPLSTLAAVGESTFTQGYGQSGIASHGPYIYGHYQPMPAAPPLPHAVDQMSNIFNNTGPAPARPTCIQCGRDFGRQSDLNRHMKKHQPDARVFRCQVHGCHYSSIREDKLKEHSRRPH